MDPAKFAELQLQMKQNQQDIGAYLQELDDWTKEMKIKEEEMLNGSSSSASAHPVRPAVTSEKQKSKTKSPMWAASKSKSKKISSYDYRAWDRFDIDAALKSSSEDEEEEEENVPQVSPRAEQEALELKEKGNKFFSQKNFEEAITCYTAALKLKPRNPVFLSNRAICFLKLEQFEDAESDCSGALSSEPRNTKALFRRATARVALGKLTEAKSDFEDLLNIDPSNKLARQEVQRLTEQTRLTKAVETLVEQEAISKIPEWFQIPMESAADFGVINVKTWKPTDDSDNLSNLSRVPIREVANFSHLWNTSLPSKKLGKIDDANDTRTQPPRFMYAPPPDSWLPVPEAASTPFQFQTDIRALRSDKNRLYEYLKKIDSSKLADLFGLSLESSMLSEIVECFEGHDVDEATSAFFKNIQLVNRYSTVALFLESSVKRSLEKFISHSPSG